MFHDQKFLIRKAGSGGMVTSTAGPDTLHTNATGRSYVVSKLMVYNNTGLAQTLLLGTLNGLGALVQLFPTITVVNGITAIYTEEELPALELAPNSLGAVAAGRTGALAVTASAVGILMLAEIRDAGS